MWPRFVLSVAVYASLWHVGLGVKNDPFQLPAAIERVPPAPARRLCQLSLKPGALLFYDWLDRYNLITYAPGLNMTPWMRVDLRKVLVVDWYTDIDSVMSG